VTQIGDDDRRRDDDQNDEREEAAGDTKGMPQISDGMAVYSPRCGTTMESHCNPIVTHPWRATQTVAWQPWRCEPRVAGHLDRQPRHRVGVQKRFFVS